MLHRITITIRISICRLLQFAADAENEDNIAEQKRQHGKRVRYGETIQVAYINQLFNYWLILWWFVIYLEKTPQGKGNVLNSPAGRSLSYILIYVFMD